MKTCPRCALINPRTATACDCGYAFSSETAETAQTELDAAKKRAWRSFARGVAIGGAGLLVSVVTFIFPVGGFAIIAYGAFFAGFGLAWLGWSNSLTVLRRGVQSYRTERRE